MLQGLGVCTFDPQFGFFEGNARKQIHQCSGYTVLVVAQNIFCSLLLFFKNLRNYKEKKKIRTLVAKIRFLDCAYQCSATRGSNPCSLAKFSKNFLRLAESLHEPID
jgi:hypothetical protein